MSGEKQTSVSDVSSIEGARGEDSIDTEKLFLNAARLSSTKNERVSEEVFTLADSVAASLTNDSQQKERRSRTCAITEPFRLPSFSNTSEQDTNDPSCLSEFDENEKSKKSVVSEKDNTLVGSTQTDDATQKTDDVTQNTQRQDSDMVEQVAVHPLAREAQLHISLPSQRTSRRHFSFATDGMRGWRRLFFFLLLLGCGYAYWTHFENRFAEIQAQNSISDKTQHLSAAEYEMLEALYTRFEDELGIKLLVRIDSRPEGVPDDLVNNAVFVSTTPSNGGTVVALPPLLRAALPGKVDGLAYEIDRCTRENSVGSCLQATLGTLFTEIQTLSQ